MKSSKSSDEKVDKRNELTKHILDLSDKIYFSSGPDAPHEGLAKWLSGDLTVAQLRVLLLLYTGGSMRMSTIAGYLGIAVSTATGILDKLVKKDMVVRDVDPADRRQVICRLSSAGQELMGGLWNVGRSMIEKMLHSLSVEQLEAAEKVAEFLYDGLNTVPAIDKEQK
jgi:DNA-binding MarR family transcriptional regulator